MAVQTTDASLDDVEPDKNVDILEELVVAGIRLAVGKSIEYPVANIRNAEIRDSVLVLTNDEGKPVFAEVSVHGENHHYFSTRDAARFVNFCNDSHDFRRAHQTCETLLERLCQTAVLASVGSYTDRHAGVRSSGLNAI